MFGLGTEYIEKGISFVNQKEYDNALECFNKHLEADSKNSIVLGLKALALMDLNRLDEALIYISKSLDIDSSNYEKLLINLNSLKNNNSNFKLVSIELYDKNNEKLVSGEIGYMISKTYTSLTGFSSKSKVYNNWGKLQMVLLALYLEENRFDFWNLGHPYMQYKFDLGAKLYSRDEFLKRWLNSI